MQSRKTAFPRIVLALVATLAIGIAGFVLLSLSLLARAATGRLHSGI